MQAVVTKL